ncbi:unnamed protein product [Urochloa decumbens]|uniref:L-gulonolactone oxidase n=1 Tax=Urochloa decumbens TaxID=240449 RepID=A0ABC9B198_9POAL
MRGVIFLLLLILVVGLSGASPPPPPVACRHGTSDCTVTNAYGSFPDRTICRAANATFPRTEEELVAAVAAAAEAKRKVKVATKYSHSLPKLACPGGHEGTIISTEKLNRTLSIDKGKGLLTVESGMLLRDLIMVAGDAGLSLPHSPYFYGLTIGGMIAAGAHGSSLWGKGGAVHEYVVGLRIVTPAPASQGFAVVRELGADDPDLDAAKVSLGVLGVISQVTLELQPRFKRAVSFVTRDDSDLAEKIAVWGGLHEFGDVSWLPWQGKAIYREDNRVDVSTPGNGLNDCSVFRAQPTLELIAARAEEEQQEEKHTDGTSRCQPVANTSLEVLADGFTNDGESFTGFPVVGFQDRIQAFGSCLDSPEDGLQSACGWDTRIRGPFMYDTGISVALSKAPAFVADLQRLRDLHYPGGASCGVDAGRGVVMRYIRASSAYLGKAEDSLDLDIFYYRSYDEGTPRAHADFYDELEQMALRKYGGVPHWGKNRDFAFVGAIARYPEAAEFLKVKDRYDPDGIFSSEWSDKVLGTRGSPSVVRPGCAIEGLCVCSDDSHCAPQQGYFCRPGKVYTEARVCTFGGTRRIVIDDEL